MNEIGYRPETGWEFCNRLSAIYQELCNRPEPSFLEVKRWLSAATEGAFTRFNLTLTHSNHPDYQSLHYFLSLRGPVWQAALFLTKHSVEVWTNLRPVQAPDEPLVPVTAIHSVLVHFLSHIVRFSNNEENASCLYMQLLQEYADEFLPAHGDYRGYLMQHIDQSSTDTSAAASEWEEKDHPISPLFCRSALQSSSRPSKAAPILPSLDSLPIQETKTFIGSMISIWLSAGTPTTQLLATALRYLIKQIHQFASSPSSLNDSALKIFKVSLPRLIAPDLYSFLVHQFQRWPLDSSFRVILETWLTFIQPWRYTSTGSQEREGERWQGFVREHWDFYAVFFELSAERLSRMDLSSSRNVQLLCRLIKVFCSEPVLRLFTEQMVEATNSNSTSAYLNSSQNSDIQVNVQQLLDKVEHSMAALRIRLNQLEMEASKDAEKRSSFWFRLFGEESGIEEEVKRTRKAITELDTVGKNFGVHFNVDFDSGESGHDLTNGLSQLDATFAYPDTGKMDPDSVLDPRSNRSVLTPLGRTQVLSKSRRFAFEDPVDLTYARDLAPIKTTEVSVLVRWLCTASICLSLRLKDSVESLYASKGALSRWFLLPPSRDYAVGSPKLSREGDVGFPRIHPPRFMASMKFLLWLLITAFSIWFFGCGVVTAVCAGFFGFCFAQCC